jgi:hypothetical protein
VSSQFAPLVFSRTKEVDFRFLVIPEDFSEGDMEWAQKHILATLLNSVELSENPRWSLFNNSQHYVIGLSCRANLLSERNVADKFNRGLYLFVGYVTKNPEFIPMQVDIFKSLYEFVHQKWEDDSIDARKLNKMNYEISLSIPLTVIQDAPRLDNNRNIAQVLVYPKSRNQELWTIFSQYRESVSLCLNVATQKDAKEGIFLNVSSVDYQSETPLVISRYAVAAPQSVQQTDLPQSDSSGDKPSSNPIPNDNLLEKISDCIFCPLKTLLTVAKAYVGDGEQKENFPTAENKSKNLKTPTSPAESPKEDLPFGGKYLDDNKK